MTGTLIHDESREPEVPPGGYTPTIVAQEQKILDAWARFLEGSIRSEDIALLGSRGLLPSASNSADMARLSMIMSQKQRALRYFKDWEDFNAAGDPGFPTIAGDAGFYVAAAAVAAGIRPTDPNRDTLFERQPWNLYWMHGGFLSDGGREKGTGGIGSTPDFLRGKKYINDNGRDATHWRYYPPYRLGWCSAQWAAERARAVSDLGLLTGEEARLHMLKYFESWKQIAHAQGLTHVEQCQVAAWTRVCFERGINVFKTPMGKQVANALKGVGEMFKNAYNGNIEGAIDAIKGIEGGGAPMAPPGPPATGTLADRRIKSRWFGPPFAAWRTVDLALMQSLGWFAPGYVASLDGPANASTLDKVLGGLTGVYDLVPGDNSGGKVGTVADALGVYVDPSTPTNKDETQAYVADLLKM